jgi:hypothetical protein
MMSTDQSAIVELTRVVDLLTETNDASEPLNPVEVERAIRDAANHVGRSVRIVNDALERYRAASREYDLAFAQEVLEAAGAVATRKYVAEIATTQLRSERDAAEVAWHFADRLAAAASKNLTAFQSINKSVMTMFSGASSGHGN